MTVHVRINALSALGQLLRDLNSTEFQSLCEQAARENPWFTKDNVRMAVDGVISFLQKDKLQQWTSPYNFEVKPKRVAIVMAGNIPLVGFHDLLAVLISGHTAVVKLSSKDSVLLKFILQELFEIEPAFRTKIELAEQLKNFDAVIATGSDNSARYFDYYFGKYPHIIRKNRTSVAILSGVETKEELHALGTDVFSYFGLGCRNISKLFVPEGYIFDKLFESWESYQPIIHHHKYCNNYDYQKSIMLVNGIPFLDNGFVMLHQNAKMVSPISVVYYETYKDQNELTEKLNAAAEKIQCIGGNTSPATVSFGQTQRPALWDYADQVNTLKFLTSLPD
ncbi:acyl-CoA reductase [Ohtaekwangia sp.]|uniref:acyl-CoA reductase n=1 Tax=Ohtaekwangia sp. TaxID=2066019 RepID=UPI002FDCCFD1